MMHKRSLLLMLAAAAFVRLALAQDKELSLVNAYAGLSKNVEKARQAFRKDRLERCEAEARVCLEKLPEHQEAHFLMALVLYKKGDFDRAVDHIQAAEAGYLRIAEAIHALGREGARQQTEAMSRMTEELSDLSGAYLITRSHGSGMSEKIEQQLMDSRQEQLQSEEARDKSESGRGVIRVPALYLFWHGNVLFKLGRTDEAEARYREAVASEPGFGEAYNNLIGLLYTEGRTEEAREVLAQAGAHKVNIQPGLKKAVLGKGPEQNGAACPAEGTFVPDGA